MSRRASAPHPLDRLRAHFRKGCDEGAASLISYIIAAAFFLVASSFLINFAAQPSGASVTEMEDAALKSTAVQALGVLLGTPGYPAAWDENTTSVEALRSSGRLGLIEEGATIRLDPTKFDALARGQFLTSERNGYVDYAEAKNALGLSGYDFHLRAFPVVQSRDNFFGTQGMTSYRVAYIGDYTGGTASDASTAEAAALAALQVGFSPTSVSLGGDVYPDSSATIRQDLLPLIGSGATQVVIANGAGTSYDFHRVAPEYLADALDLETGLSTALALSDADAQVLSYTKGREVRAILGAANMSDLSSAQLLWKEWVDTDLDGGAIDAGDYGNIEISTDNGETWCKPTGVGYTMSQDTLLTLGSYATRALVINEAACEGVAFNAHVLVAAHWKADNDNDRGRGWVIDDVEMFPAATTGFSRSFEEPEYDLLVVGSDVDRNALAPDDVKSAIRDYVAVHGGRLLALGGDTNTQWLEPLFHVGIQGASPGVASPDTTHPLLTVPNQLAWSDYDHGTPPASWHFTAGSENLFNTVVADSAGDDILAISGSGAFGSSTDGSVMLATYLPYLFGDADQRSAFFANAITYGRFHSLFMEVGPEVPTSIPVSSSARSAMMNIAKTGDAQYEEIAFILYVWPGSTTEQSLVDTALYATPPTNLNITWGPDNGNAGKANVTLEWYQPASSGSGSITHYAIGRGFADGYLSSLTEFIVSPTCPVAHCTYTDDNLEFGTTYFYNVTAITYIDSARSHEKGTPSASVNATPITAASAPLNAVATGGVGDIHLQWDAPADDGGSSVSGYNVYLENAQGGFDLLYEVGSVTSIYDYTTETTERTYKVRAVTGADEGAWSAEFSGAALAPAVLPDAPTLTGVTAATPGDLLVTWTAPASTGTSSLTGFELYRSDDGVAWAPLASIANPATLSYSDDDLGTNETRHYKLTAVTAVGESDDSATGFATTMAAPDTPMSPSALRVTTSTTVSWVAPASEWPIDHYDVWRGASEGALTTFLGSTSAIALVDSGGAAGSWYAIKAVSDAGTSNAATVREGLPSTPTLVSVTNTTVGQLTLTWTAPADWGTEAATGYKVYRDDGAGGYALLATVPDELTFTYDDTGLGNNVSHSYKVTAYTAAGESDPSAIKTQKTKGAPDTPVIASATRLITTTTVVWAAPSTESAIDHYDVWSGATQGAETTFLGSTSTLQMIDSAGSSGKWYVVKAISESGTSGGGTKQSD